jgi:hypothetical protein
LGALEVRLVAAAVWMMVAFSKRAVSPATMVSGCRAAETVAVVASRFVWVLLVL